MDTEHVKIRSWCKGPGVAVAGNRSEEECRGSEEAWAWLTWAWGAVGDGVAWILCWLLWEVVGEKGMT